jgi:hypothetical protein
MPFSRCSKIRNRSSTESFICRTTRCNDATSVARDSRTPLPTAAMATWAPRVKDHIQIHLHILKNITYINNHKLNMKDVKLPVNLFKCSWASSFHWFIFSLSPSQSQPLVQLLETIPHDFAVEEIGSQALDLF